MFLNIRPLQNLMKHYDSFPTRPSLGENMVGKQFTFFNVVKGNSEN